MGRRDAHSHTLLCVQFELCSCLLGDAAYFCCFLRQGSSELLVFEVDSHAAKTGLKLATQPRVAELLTLWHHLLRAGIAGMRHYT